MQDKTCQVFLRKSFDVFRSYRETYSRQTKEYMTVGQAYFAGDKGVYRNNHVCICTVVRLSVVWILNNIQYILYYGLEEEGALELHYSSVVRAVFKPLWSSVFLWNEAPFRNFSGGISIISPPPRAKNIVFAYYIRNTINSISECLKMIFCYLKMFYEKFIQ